MKNSLFIAFILLLVSSLTIHAQYSKTSVFARNGRFYQVGTGARLFGNGVSIAPVLTWGWGKDKGTKRVFHWWDFELVAPSKYTYTLTETPSTGGAPATLKVLGKTNTSIMFRYNWAFYILNNQLAENKFLPFFKVAFELGLKNRYLGKPEAYQPSANWSNPNLLFQTQISGNIGADLGLGCIYKIDENKAINFSAGYRAGSKGVVPTNYKIFYIAPDHPYINIAFRYIMKGSDD